MNVWEASTGSLKNRLEGPGGDIEVRMAAVSSHELFGSYSAVHQTGTESTCMRCSFSCEDCSTDAVGSKNYIVVGKTAVVEMASKRASGACGLS